MRKPKHPPHFIREWRTHRKMSLRHLADRLVGDDGENAVSYASLSRIERGVQPYTQPVLEKVAEALGTEPASLLMRDPTQEHGLWSIWSQIQPQDRPQAIRVLKTFAKTDEKTGT